MEGGTPLVTTATTTTGTSTSTTTTAQITSGIRAPSTGLARPPSTVASGSISKMADPLQEITSALLASKTLPLTSELIKKYKTLPEAAISIITGMASTLTKKRRLSKEDKSWLEDYITHARELSAMLNAIESGLSDNEIYEDINTRQIMHRGNLETEVPPLNKNKIFLLPDNFEGDNKKARAWLEQYEQAAEANDWNELQKLKYFPSFLAGTARIWFTVKLSKNPATRNSWIALKLSFTRFYLGTDDVFTLQRQIDESYQGDKESITQFMPRLLQLVEMLDPNKSEEQLVLIVRSKLRSYFQRQLAPFHITLLDNLNDMCLRLEASSASALEARNKERERNERRQAGFNKSNNRNNSNQDKQVNSNFNNNKNNSYARNNINYNNNNQNNNSKGGNSNYRNQGPNNFNKNNTNNRPNERQFNNREQVRSVVKCYRCDRQGHISTHCRASSKQNGDPCNQRPKPVNMVQEPINPEKNLNNNNVQQGIALPPPVVSHIRTAARPINMINACLSNDEDLIEQDISVNNTKVKAVIDTGARMTVISSSYVANQNWPIVGPAPELIGPDGKQLETHGVIKANLELTIGKTSVVVVAYLPVVEGLATNILAGLDILRAWRVRISTSSSSLSFERIDREASGMRVISDTILSPRSLSFVNVRVDSEVNLIATRPFNFEPSVLLANSVNKVINKSTTILLANIDTCEIMLEQDKQIASFDEYDEGNAAKTAMLDSVMIEGDETIKVGNELDERQRAEVRELIGRHRDAFSIGGRLGHTNLTSHEINLHEGARPSAEPLRRRPIVHVEEAKKQVQSMLEEGIIEPSCSPWAAAYVVVKKKTGGFRICVDFRNLNSKTKMDAYPLPLIDKCIESVANNRYYSLLDFASGYHQIPMAPKSKELTAFKTEDGLWQYTRMPFGLCSAPASFQRLMNCLFSGLIGLELQVFIDDVCVATTTWQRHLEVLERVLTVIEKANLKLKPSKCVIGASQVIFLGHQISREGVQADPEKLRAISDLPVPKNAQEIRRVVGLFSYYRRFVPNFAMIVSPLTNLTRKNSTYEWGEREERAFKTIIYELMKNATLTTLLADAPIVLKTDASRIGVAGILLQFQDESWRMVSCCSRRLNSAESNYGISDLEALAIVYSVCKFRHYLLGRQFKIVTDHHALCVLTSRTPSSGRLQRWAIILSEFQYEVVYAKGAAHQDVDCLSRAPINDSDPYVEKIFSVTLTERGNELTRKLPRVTTKQQAIPIDKENWAECIDNSEEGVELLEEAERGEKGLKTKDELIYKNGKLYVPPQLRAKILRESHDDFISGHDGAQATLYRMSSLWWPGMLEEVKNYVKSCEACQMRKKERRRPAGIMRKHDAIGPMQKVSIDYVGPWPETLNRNKFILVAIDVFSRFIYAQAMIDQTSEGFMEFMIQYMSRFGAPRVLISDNAMAFHAREAKIMLDRWKVKLSPAASRHHQGNSPAERAIQSISEKIAMIVRDGSFQWDEAVPLVCLSINTKLCKSSGYTPYELMFGRSHRLMQTSIDSEQPPFNPAIEEMNRQARENDIKSHLSNKKYVRERESSLERGDLVYLERSDRRKRLSERYEGPFEVIDRFEDICRVRNLNKGKDERLKHVSQMKRVHARIASQVGLVLIAVSLAAGAQIHTAPAVQWERVEEKFVIAGQETHGAEMFYANPCVLISKYKRLLTIDPAKYQFQHGYVMPTPQNKAHAVSLFQQQQQMQHHQQQAQAHPKVTHQNNAIGGQQQGPVHVNSQSMAVAPTITSNIAAAEAQCNKVFEEFMTAIESVRFYERNKRQVALAAAAGAMGYYYLSNLFTTTKHRLEEESDEDFAKRIETEIKKINEKQDLQIIIDQWIDANHRATQQWLGRLTDTLNYLILIEPEVSAVTAVIITKILEKKGVVERLATGLTLHSVDMTAIGQIYGPGLFGKVQANDATLIILKKTPRGSLGIVIQGPVRDYNTRVHRVRALWFVSRNGSDLVLHRYNGKLHLVHNTTSDCARGLDPDFSPFIDARCEENRYRDPQLKTWEKSVITRRDAPPTSSYTAWPDIIIQCWPQNLTISKPFVKTITCPMKPLALNTSWSFNTSDGFNHDSTEVQLTERFVKMDLQVSDTHFNEINQEAESESAIEQLIDKQIVLSQESTAYHFGGVRVTHRDITTTTGKALSILITILLALWMLRKLRDYLMNDPHRVLREQVIHMEPIYDTQLARIHSRRHSHSAISKGGM